MGGSGRAPSPPSALRAPGDPGRSSIAPPAAGWLAAALDAALTFIVLAQILEHLRLPFAHAPDGIVSAIGRHGFDPRTNYVRYALATGGACAVFGLTLWRGTSLLTTVWSGLRRATGVVGVDARTNVAIAGLVVAFAVVAINVTAAPPAAPLIDTFHEGERLAFLPAVRGASRPFEQVFLAHGFGLNVLPALVADRLAPGSDRIALVRLGVVALHLSGYLSTLLAVIFAVRALAPRAARRRALAAALGALVAAALVFRIDVRDAMFLGQLALIMGFLASVRGGCSQAATTAALAVGISLPVAFLYVYDRAVYMVAIAAVVSVALTALGRRAVTRWLGGVIAGIALGVPAVLALVGPTGVGAIAQQVAYWARYGSYIWVKPWPPAPCCAVRDLVLLAGALLIQLIAVGYLWRRIRAVGRFRAALPADMPIVVLLVTALVFTRIALERSDTPHFYFATMPAMLLGAVLTGALAAHRDPGAPTPVTVSFTRAQLVLIVAVGLALGFVAGRARVLSPSSLTRPLNPVRAFSTIAHYRADLATRDALIIADGDRAAVEALRPEVAAGRCFFTLTSEGGWYQLFDRPSCSRFHHLVFARTHAAQADLIAALERERPSVILFSNDRGTNAIDGITIFNTNAPVVQHVMSAYRPYKVVGGNWFWRRAEEPYRFLAAPAGRLDPVPGRAPRQRDLVVTGTIDQGPAIPDGGAVLVTTAPDDTPIWAGRVVGHAGGASPFRAHVPTAALAPGPHRLRFWLMTEPGLRPLGEAQVDLR